MGAGTSSRHMSDTRGETLVETLVAILIGALSVSLLLVATLSSASMNKKADELTGSIHAQENNAIAYVQAEGSGAGTVEVSDGSGASDRYSVVFYGGDQVAAYGVTSGPGD